MQCGSPVQRNGVLGKGALRLQLAMLRAATRQVQLRSMVERAQEELMAMNDRQYKQVSMEYMKKRHGLVSAVSTSWMPSVPGMSRRQRPVCMLATSAAQPPPLCCCQVAAAQPDPDLSQGKWLPAIILAEPASKAQPGCICHKGLA